MTDVRVAPLTGTQPVATVSVPGSRSVTNRALMCAAMADGVSQLRGVLDADDTHAMMDGLRSLGAPVEFDPVAHLAVVHGTGGAPGGGVRDVFTRLSGTTSRFLAAWCLTGSGEYRLDAEAPMRTRPMGDLFSAIRSLGGRVESPNGCLPATIWGNGSAGGSVELPGNVSSQFLSGLLMAGPVMTQGLQVSVVGELKSLPYVEMTRQVMGQFGVTVDGTSVAPSHYVATDYSVEPDASSACYFWAAAAMTGGTVTVAGLSRAALQGDVAFVDVLARMGCDVTESHLGLTVRGPDRLRAVDVDLSDISDQAPTFAVVAALAEGQSRATGIGFIRRKESDRIAAVVDNLGRLGIDASEEDDGFVITGGQPHGASIATHDDHRLAMSFALVGLITDGVVIEDAECVAKTFPDFFAALDVLRGAN